MRDFFNKLFTKQIPIRWLGTFRQLFGGAATWITLAILVFSAVSAWNTASVMIIREHFPWLNFGVFIAFIVVGVVAAMWFEHKFIQPAVMMYWNRMHFTHGNPQQEQLDRMEAQLSELLEKKWEEDTGEVIVAGRNDDG